MLDKNMAPDWEKMVSPLTGKIGCRQFRLEYDRDYGVARRSGWTVVVDGMVVVELMETPQAALEQAVEKMSCWDLPACCAAHTS